MPSLIAFSLLFRRIPPNPTDGSIDVKPPADPPLLLHLHNDAIVRLHNILDHSFARIFVERAIARGSSSTFVAAYLFIHNRNKAPWG